MFHGPTKVFVSARTVRDTLYRWLCLSKAMKQTDGSARLVGDAAMLQGDWPLALAVLQ